MKAMNSCPIPAASRLLWGISTSDSASLMKELRVKAYSFDKGEPLIRQGDKMTSFWLIVSGEVMAYTEHGHGKRSVAVVAGPGEVIGLLFEYSDLTEHPTTAVATKDSVILVFPKPDLLEMPTLVNRQVTRRFVTNLVSVISQAAFRARFKAFVVSHKSIAGRVAAYLSQKARLFGKPVFDIPVDRQGMADFLDVDRCALSVVLGKMRAQGLIAYSKNHFEILRRLDCGA